MDLWDGSRGYRDVRRRIVTLALGGIVTGRTATDRDGYQRYRRDEARRCEASPQPCMFIPVVDSIASPEPTPPLASPPRLLSGGPLFQPPRCPRCPSVFSPGQSSTAARACRCRCRRTRAQEANRLRDPRSFRCILSRQSTSWVCEGCERASAQARDEFRFRLADRRCALIHSLDATLSTGETGIFCLAVHPEARPLDSEQLADLLLDIMRRVSRLDGFEERKRFRVRCRRDVDPLVCRRGEGALNR
jgi:hypothetical protein